MTATRRLREDCGGERFLDLRGLSVLAMFSLTSSVLSSAPTHWSSWWGWTVANLAALVVTAAPVLALRQLLKRRRSSPLTLTVTVIIGSAIGATKGVATSLLGGALGLIDDPALDIVGRTANTAFLGGVVIPATAALLAAQDRWHSERDLLMVELVRRALDDGDLGEAPYRKRLETVVTQAQRRLPHLPAEAAAVEMRRLVDQELRPLSAEVLAATRTPPPLSSGWDLVRLGLTNEAWAVRSVTVVFGITAWLLLNRHTTPADAIVLTVLVGAALAVVLTVGNILRRHLPRTSLFVLVTAVVAIGFGQRPLAHLTVGTITSLDHLSVSLASAMWLGQLLVVSAAITAARHERDVIRAQLLSLLGPQGVRDATAHGVRAVDGREFAFFVHGHLQNQLIAAAQRLDSTSDPSVTESTKRSVIELLNQAHQPRSDQTPLGHRLRDVIARWDGIADVTLTAPPDIDSTPPAVTDHIVHVLTEAVTNAVRHGAAQQVDICITRDRSGVVIVVSDDGFGPRRGRPGTGTRYLELVAPRSWSLTPAPHGGARLTVRLPDEAH